MKMVMLDLQPNCCSGCDKSNGFTLVEVIVAATIIIVAVAGTLGGFNAFISASNQTQSKSEQQKMIDTDIAKISKLSQVYTACINPRGSVPAPSETCQGLTASSTVQMGDSLYYFPPATSDQATFFSACSASDANNHITKNFIKAIDLLRPVSANGVTRQAATRDDEDDASNHLVRVRWVQATNTSNTLRLIKVVPLVSAWCK